MFPSLVVMLASVTIARSQDSVANPSILDAARMYARFADQVAVKLDLSDSIVRASAPGHLEPIGRQQLDGEAFRLSVAGPKAAPLALDALVMWTACSKYNLGLPFEYLSAAHLEDWAARK